MNATGKFMILIMEFIACLYKPDNMGFFSKMMLVILVLTLKSFIKSGGFL